MINWQDSLIIFITKRNTNYPFHPRNYPRLKQLISHKSPSAKPHIPNNPSKQLPPHTHTPNSRLHPNRIPRNPLNLGKVPLLITQRTNTPSLIPPLYTIQVEHMSTYPESDGQPGLVVGGWVGLVFYGWFVESLPH